MKWVTWQNVGIDRIGCAWLIRKHIDSRAEFIFVTEGSTDLPPKAEAFDIPGAKLSHHGGHCSFHAVLKTYKISDPILERISRIIDEADTVQEVSIEPAATGLDLICRGIRLTSQNDQTALQRGAAVYDAHYAVLKEDTKPR
jgi:hypothetical protein